MELSVIESVTARRDYQQLVRARRRFSFTLTALMIATYYGFILLVALAPRARRAAVPRRDDDGRDRHRRRDHPGDQPDRVLRAAREPCVRPPRRRDPAAFVTEADMRRLSMALGAPAVLASTAAHAVSVA